VDRWDAEMRARVFRRIAFAGVLLVMGCGSLGCALGRPETVGSQLIDGVRSDPDRRGLVVSYVGGACDGPAHLVLTESSTRVELNVVVQASSGACADVGIPRTVGARLAQPIGQRTVWAGGREQILFDGAALLVPSSLPADFAGMAERGLSTEPASTPAESLVTTIWVTTHLDGGPDSTSDEGRVTRGAIEGQIGPTSTDPFRGGTRVRTVKVGTNVAHLYRFGSSKTPRGWAYVWTVDARRIQVKNDINCPGDRLLSPTELLRVAESLRPV